MHQTKQVIISFIVLFVLVVVVYFPSLSGGFIYDDFWSLQKLSEVNGAISWDSIKSFLMSSDTGPLKRPLSMLSFLIDANDWPAEPYSFKVTNLIIHALNGILLFCLLFTILKSRVADKQKALIIAFFATLLWMVHPFLVSTVAYVVQRMAMLPVLFSLLSMWLYLKIRLKFSDQLSFQAVCYLGMVVYGLTLLAALSKENGLLLLLYIPLFEYLICQKYLGLRALNKHSKWMFCYLPIALFVSAFIVKFPDFYRGYADRDFGLYERLMSEPRALSKYLWHWVVPNVMTEGIYTDTFQPSTSLLQPISTLFSLLFICSLIIVAFITKHKAPLLSFAVAFYLVSHIIESSVVPLQLYFEHRNYSAFLFLAVPPVLLTAEWIKNKQLMWLILLSISLMMGATTYHRSHIWGDSVRMKTESLQAFPESIRARIAVAELLESETNHQHALNLLEDGIKIKNSPSLQALKLQVKCKFTADSVINVELLVDSISLHGLKRQDILPIGSLLKTLLNDQCINRADNSEQIEDILNSMAVRLNAESSLGWAMYYYASGRLAFQQKKYPQSLEFFVKSFEQNKEYDQAIMAVSQLLINQQPELALKLLKVIEGEYNNGYVSNLPLQKEIKRFIKIATEESLKKHEDINHNPSQE
ncbi:hypothetical protein [Marinicella meishanensis]|uniref:hypothetical protein n=1 Tax=Marinicella meishanensis TaxID=2873263 RepID=UPI001CBE8EE2|nr:hypothetical protein [Marinicella sp. NBU2979]